ncbi:MAG TPA: hypothetical protein VGC38_08845 [Pseudolabrys sp.]
MSVESDLRKAELEIRAWTAPNTPRNDAINGLLEAYQYRDEAQKEAFVAALIGRLIICDVFSSVRNASPSANS